jgi:hypothetical protein
MDDKWLSAAEASELVAPLAYFQPTNLICSRANDGMIECRARRLIIRDKIIDDANVPADFWWARGGAALDQNWSVGDFSTWIDGKYHLRAYGVKFKRSDIEAMLPRPSQSAFKAAPPGTYAPTARCIAELAKGLDCEEHEAEHLLLKHCQLGAIPGRAGTMLITRTNRYGTDTEQYENAEIPTIFWEKCALSPDAILDWGKGRLIGKAYVDGDNLVYRLDDVELEVSGIVDLEAFVRRDRGAKKSCLHTNKAALPNLEPKPAADEGEAVAPPEMPPLSEAMLQRWWQHKAAVRDSLNLEELLVLAKHAHPGYSIARERIRRLGGGRKRGRKPVGGKRPAE